MKLGITKFVFTIIILVSQSSTCWSTQIDNDVHITEKFPNHVEETLRYLCEDDFTISLNFTNVEISKINQDFINNPLITCLKLTGNIRNIERGAFNKLPNLTRLFLFNNGFERSLSKFFNIGSYNNLQVLVIKSENIRRNQENINSYYQYPNRDRENINIYDEYPNLEILSIRKNNFHGRLQFSPWNTSLKLQTTPSYEITPTVNRTPFPKLKILDLSENDIQVTDFLNLLPNSLHFLDLHNNSLSYLKFENKITKLFALNLNNNRFNYISDSHNYNKQYSSSLSVAGLKNLHYLSISTCKISVIEPDAFEDNNKLLYLNLSSNYIKHIHSVTFANLQQLKTLDLSHNQLEEVPQLLNATEINNLYINYNNITKLCSYSFMQMTKLTKLLLGENRIDQIDINAFAHLSSLEELNLSRNMLSFLPEKWTEYLVALKYLDLSGNQFTSLESLSLTNTIPLIKIYLVMNPLEFNIGNLEKLPQNLTINFVN
ncbi:leucine-rich repeats and immunoglobulin-like domains protein 2 [Solenopsis invicta]|uniref:leucine-rich repeats and immunoglobulin-like domains protein 2 n=1 Tax=Solenopsis invicta TaxID=13686 RepID=UPI000595FF40|nr:leucine-rich repeats and immunoglobulin-like domains protein 2 [Solenopsis invicta]